MDEKLRADIEAIVKSIFANREESEQRAALESTLEKSAKAIEDLTADLEAKVASLTELEAEFAAYKEEQAGKTSAAEASVEAKDVEITALKDKLTATEESLKTVEAEKDAVSEELEGIKLDRLAEARMTELTELKVARQDVEAQKGKVRAMTEEEYATYKEELVAIRASIVAELGSTGEQASTGADGEVPPAAQVDDAAAAAAALNLETSSASSVKASYAELGKALAERIKNTSRK